MGINEDYYKLEKGIQYLKNFKNEYQFENSLYKISNINQIKKGIDILSEIDYLIHLTSEIEYKTKLYKVSKDQEYFDSTEEAILSKNINSLIKGIELLLWYHKYQSKDESDLKKISIKLPELDNFDSLIKVSNDLKKAIEIPIIDSGIESARTTIVSVDRGSIWLNISLGTAVAIKLIAGITWSAAYIRKKRAEAKAFEQHARTLELKNESLSSLIDAQKTQLNNLVEAEAKSIANEQYKTSDPEVLKRLELSLTTVSNLIDKGVKIIPSTNEDNVELQKLFPNYEQLDLIESKIKKIAS